MKQFVVPGLLSLVMSLSLLGQTNESITLDWEASVEYGTFGQRTVVVNDTLWHFGGRFFYGTPFGIASWEHSYIEYKAPENSYWSVDTVTTNYRYYGNAEVYDSRVYLLGGGGTQPFSVEIFHPGSGTITLGADMPATHRNGGSVLYEGKIYMVAGSDNETGAFIDRVDIYDISSNTWTVGAPLPLAMQTEAVVVGDKIYVMGGYDSSTRNEVFEYDITGNSWSQIGTMPEPTSAHRLAAYNGFIYVVGDFADLDRIMRYTIADGSWVVYDSNFIGRRHASVVINNDRLYIIAGNSSHNGVYQYYRLVQSIDLSNVVSVASRPGVQPSRAQLGQNFPNPFNPTTSIRLFMDHASDVEITIFNLKGQQVRSLHAAPLAFGEHEITWDGRNDAGLELASGQYMYTLKTPEETQSKRMLLLR